MIDYQLLYLRSLALAIVFAVLVAAAGWLGNELDVGPGGVPIWDPDGRAYWLVGLAITLIAGITYRTFDTTPLRSSPQRVPTRQASASAGEFATNWLLPTTIVLAMVLMLGVYRGTTAIVIGALLTLVGLMTGVVSRQIILLAGAVSRDRARIAFTLIVHGVAFLALSMIYIHKVRSLFSATAVMIVGVMLLLSLSEGEHGLFYRRLVYALVGGIMLGQVTWSLNYWQATGWTGGAVLLVGFYLLGGLILTQFRRGVHVRDVVEYGSVSLIAFGIVVYSLFV